MKNEILHKRNSSIQATATAVRNSRVCALAGLICLCVVSYASPAQPQDRTLGAAFSELQRVGEDQAQVIYYRDKQADSGSVANVYLDKQFVTALRPGGHVSFCVAAGSHLLGAYMDDAPRYEGKNEELYQAAFSGGKTYYMKVREQGGNEPLAIKKEPARVELEGSRQQVHLLSRAESSERCRHYGFHDRPAKGSQMLVLQADDSFSETGSVTASGRHALATLVEDLRVQGAQIVKITVEGHSDPLGTVAYNQNMAQRWANATRFGLIAQGVPQAIVSAESMGSRMLLERGCYGDKKVQRQCNAPNRRVIVQVETAMVESP
ncbi:OmpA family protein [Stenotrophomonas sp.]|uniref:OmpA family protein n=1 Tax=Stenotrophomonas sp. TaxID=69392 RepID=UPI00289FACF9|nr:OmpA family protein [Stenotrophomonas sp.]